jgi:tRNA (guanine-N7-)-methyltransferase
MNSEIKEKLWKITTRKIFDSSHVLIPSSDKPFNVKFDFPKFNSYFLEIGSGWGEVAIQLAKNNPNTLFILIERKIERVSHTLKKIESSKIENIKIFLINLNWFFEGIFEKNSFDTIFMNFPDPWPKKKHFKHRTFTEDFYRILYTLISLEGKFLFATDSSNYARNSIRIIRKMKLELPYLSFDYHFQRNGFPVSFFEKEKQDSNSKIYYLEMKKP